MVEGKVKIEPSLIGDAKPLMFNPKKAIPEDGIRNGVLKRAFWSISVIGVQDELTMEHAPSSKEERPGQHEFWLVISEQLARSPSLQQQSGFPSLEAQVTINGLPAWNRVTSKAAPRVRKKEECLLMTTKIINASSESKICEARCDGDHPDRIEGVEKIIR